jgi:capsular polysaccharide biosynthesis protein
MPRAALDLRLPWPLGRTVLLVGVAVAIVVGVGTAALGAPRYHGELFLFVPKLNRTNPSRGIEIVDRRVTAMTAIARSEIFLLELQRETGADVGVDQLAHMVDATRPHFGAVALITVDGDSGPLVENLTQHLSTAMSTVVDRLRSSSGDIAANNGLNLAIGDDPDYRGPLYLEMFTDLSSGQSSSVSVTQPRVVLNSLMAFLVAVLLTGAFGAIAHQRPRVSSVEDLDELLDVEQLASLPRPSRSRRRRSSRLLLGFANALAAIATDDRYAVGFAGAGTPGLRRRFVRCMATTTAAVTGSSVVVVDLDAGAGWLTRQFGRQHAGLLDRPADDATPVRLRHMPRWSLPRWSRRLARDVPVLQVGIGMVPDGSIDADERLAQAVAALRAEHVVLVNLPRIPGPVTVGTTLGALDLSVLVLLDGWTPIEEARVVDVALTAGADGPVGSVVLAN